MSVGYTSYTFAEAPACETCGQPAYPSMTGAAHKCNPADPRIMKELSEIKAMLQRIREIVEAD